MYWRFPPRSGLFLRRWYLISSIFGVGYTTFGIRALDSRVSLLQTGHRGIFTINFFYEVSEAEIFRVWSWNPEEYCVKISDLGSQYFRRYHLWKLGRFFKLLNRSSWHFRYKIVSTKVQNLKFIWYEAEILRKVIKKFQNLVRNIFEDMICGR